MQTLALFTGGAPGPLEIILILFVVLLLFGAKRLPELSRSLGRSLSEFKKGREENTAPSDGDETPGDSSEDVAGDKKDG